MAFVVDGLRSSSMVGTRWCKAVDTVSFVPENLTQSPPEKWLLANVPGEIGFDPWVHTPESTNCALPARR